jgi:hypothetical protein
MFGMQNFMSVETLANPFSEEICGRLAAWVAALI